VQWQTGSTASISNVLGAPARPFGADCGYGLRLGRGGRGCFRQGGLDRWEHICVGKRPGRGVGNCMSLTLDSAPVISGDKFTSATSSGRFGPRWPLVVSDRQLTAPREGRSALCGRRRLSVFGGDRPGMNWLRFWDASPARASGVTPAPNFVKDSPSARSGVFAIYASINRRWARDRGVKAIGTAAQL